MKKTYNFYKFGIFLFLLMFSVQLTMPVHAVQDGWVKKGEEWQYIKNGTPLKSCWLFDKGRWYRFNAGSVMVTGWYSANSTERYYLDSTGAMVSNRWLLKDGKWFYFQNDGKAYYGMMKYNGYFYFLKPYSNEMAQNELIGIMADDEPTYDRVFHDWAYLEDGRAYLGARPKWNAENGVFITVYPSEILPPLLEVDN